MCAVNYGPRTGSACKQPRRLNPRLYSDARHLARAGSAERAIYAQKLLRNCVKHFVL